MLMERVRSLYDDAMSYLKMEQLNEVKIKLTGTDIMSMIILIILASSLKYSVNMSALEKFIKTDHRDI